MEPEGRSISNQHVISNQKLVSRPGGLRDRYRFEITSHDFYIIKPRQGWLRLEYGTKVLSNRHCNVQFPDPKVTYATPVQLPSKHHWQLCGSVLTATELLSPSRVGDIVKSPADLNDKPAPIGPQCSNPEPSHLPSKMDAFA